MARYNVVEVKACGGKVTKSVVSRNVTKGEASRIETTKNEEALKSYEKALVAFKNGAGSEPPIISYIAVTK